MGEKDPLIYYDNYQEVYMHPPNYFDDLAEEILRFLKKKKNISILDIGCGFGDFLSSFQKKLGKEAKYYGLTIAKHEFDFIKKNHPFIKVVLGKQQELVKIFPSEKFDVIINFHTLSYIFQDEQPGTVKQMLSKLNDKGLLILGLIDDWIKKSAEIKQAGKGYVQFYFSPKIFLPLNKSCFLALSKKSDNYRIQFWEKIKPQWESNFNNPIIDGDKLFGSGHRTEDSKIAKKGDSYYMVISSGRDGDSMDIYMLKSNSLTGPWKKIQENPIISRGKFYNFDYRYLRVGSLVLYKGIWYLYYSGQNLLGNDAVGVATTSEKDFPFKWRKHDNNPIFKRRGKSWESRSIISLCMKRINGLWYGHYSGHGRDKRYHLGICYGNSPYGPFTRYPANPILGPGEGWDFGGPSRPDFVQSDSKIYGAYEAAGGIGTPFRVGEYFGDSIKTSFSKNPNSPSLLRAQFANPCLWYEQETKYLFIGSKALDDITDHWRYIYLFSKKYA